MVRNLMNPDQFRRMTIQECLQHSWMKGYRVDGHVLQRMETHHVEGFHSRGGDMIEVTELQSDEEAGNTIHATLIVFGILQPSFFC